MSPYVLKVSLATALVIVALVSFLSMMSLQGRLDRKGDPARLRRIHRRAGLVFVLLLVPLVFLGERFIKEMADGLSVRAAFHFALALGLVCLLLLKVLVVRFFRGYLKIASGIGMTLFVLLLVIYLITAGFVFLNGFPAT
jgi:Family of unknown function (DUF6529)